MEKLNELVALAEKAGRKLSLEWVYEDELPDGYPYDEMFPFSKVDIVRMFPIFVTIPAADLAELVPGEFPTIRLQKAKLWIDLVLMDKPGMKEAQTISAILRNIEGRND